MIQRLVQLIINWIKGLFKREEKTDEVVRDKITIKKIVKEGGRFNKSKDLSQSQLQKRKRNRGRNRVARRTRKDNG